MKTFSVSLLTLAGLGFLAFGAWLVLDPAGGLASVQVMAVGPAGLVELRAFYGGLELGLGAYLLACAAKPDWRRPGLWLTALANGGIGLTRMGGILASGVMTPFFVYALAWELGFAVLAAACLASRKVP